jgi:hypothetical protein
MAGDHERLERPGRPERDDGEPVVVHLDDPLATDLLLGVVEEEKAAVELVVTALGRVLPGRLARQGRAGPDLAVRVGLEAPIDLPRFSKTWTHGYVSPSSAVWAAHTSTTLRTASGAIRARPWSWRGEKQMTRLVPLSPSATRRPSVTRSVGESGVRALKSWVNTNVVS